MFKEIDIRAIATLFLLFSVIFCIAVNANASDPDDPYMPDSIIVGNLDGTPLHASPDGIVNIPVWANNDEDIVLIYIPIAIGNSYISQNMEGHFYGLFDSTNTPHWDHCVFTMNYYDFPEQGITSYPLLCISEREEPFDWLVFNTDSSWVKIAEFVFELNSDSLVIGDTIQIVEGLNPVSGPSEFVVPNGDYSFKPVFIGGRIAIVHPLYEYLPGDANMNVGLWPPAVLGSDITYLTGYFTGNPSCTPCNLDGFWASADANGDCSVTGSDVTCIVYYLIGLGTIDYCPDYEPVWPTPADLPPNMPSGWPNCEPVMKNNRINPSSNIGAE